MTQTTATERTPPHRTAHPSRLSDAEFDALRATGDPDVDALVEQVLESADGGRRGYNMMLDVADQVVAAPSLLLADSHLRRTIDAMPGSLRDYFAPQPAPDWLDADKLELGSKAWETNLLASLGVLYASSLPACYLVKRGIPALYGSAKLRNPRYIYQRIYETGVMLDAVMDVDGLRVLREAVHPGATRIAQALDEIDPEGAWQQRGGELRRTAGGAADAPAHDALLEALSAGPGVRRYLYGKGFVAARKVRFLHASMRYLLLQVHAEHGEDEADVTSRLCDHLADKGWDVEALGMPINQEDLAYTLLTFGYLIPIGLRHWGVRVTDEERDAFLHRWKVVGYLMGIDERLLTDDWDEAQALFERLHARQAGASDEGVALTDSLLGFLAEYIPDHFQLGKRIGASMIVDQLGDVDARMILSDELFDSTRTPLWRTGYIMAIAAVRTFYWLRGTVLRRLPVVGRVFTNVLHRTGEELIQSWRGAYDRRAFYVPATADTWKLQRGVTDAFLERLRGWRRRVFNAVMACIGAMIGGSVLVGVGVLLWFMVASGIGLATGAAGAALLLLGAAGMEFWLPSIFAARPQVDDLPHVAAGAGTLGAAA